MKIYLVRHGQTDSNAQKIYNFADEDINDAGVTQATQLRDKIRQLKYDAVIASTMLRAHHTAEIITDNAPMILDSRIRERDLGDLTGLPLETVDRDDYWNYNSTTRYGTAEPVRDFFARVYDFINELKTKNYTHVLIVAHSGVSRAFSAYFDGIGDGKMLHRGLANCAVAEYEL